MLRPSMRLFATLLLSLMVLFANEMKPSEARTCKSASQKFRGICVSNRNCASVCSTEGFPGGECEGLRRRCFCTRNC